MAGAAWYLLWVRETAALCDARGPWGCGAALCVRARCAWRRRTSCMARFISQPKSFRERADAKSRISLPPPIMRRDRSGALDEA